MNRKEFDRVLKAYDHLLYTKWNAKKCKGHGCWEIRRKPEFHSTLDVCELGEDVILKVGPYEVDFVHHVLDAEFLNYDLIRKLREMDTFQYGGATPAEAATHWQNERERRSEAAREAAKEQGMKMRLLASKEFRAQIRAFKEYVRNGGNPHDVMAHWGNAPTLE